jgi:hypothetical protein
MNDMKTLVQSRTLWANVVGLVAIVLSGFGFRSAGVDADQIVDVILQVVAGMSFLFSTVFRILATKKISL